MKPLFGLSLLALIAQTAVPSSFAQALPNRMTCGGTLRPFDGGEIPLATKTVVADDVEGYQERALDMQVFARLSKSGQMSIQVISTQRRAPRKLGGVIGDGPSLELEVSELRGDSLTVKCASETVTPVVPSN
ncbi:MAG: hypothetical protein JNL01_12190 [Bdellovibrionales bacterium]|nr:hypothetical protein [Bdellovibrionales bacterium]